MASPLIKLAGQLTRISSGGRIASQDDTGSSGAGRAKLRLSRGFPCGLVYGITPYKIGRPTDKNSCGGRVARQDDTESPGAGRAKLRLSRGFPRGFAYGITPYKIGRPTDKNFMWGVASQARMTWKAPVRAAPASPYHPALPPRGLVYNITLYGLGQPTDKGFHLGSRPSQPERLRKFESLR